jgi:hypothetical protein
MASILDNFYSLHTFFASAVYILLLLLIIIEEFTFRNTGSCINEGGYSEFVSYVSTLTFFF